MIEKIGKSVYLTKVFKDTESEYHEKIVKCLYIYICYCLYINVIINFELDYLSESWQSLREIFRGCREFSTLSIYVLNSGPIG